MAKLGWRLCYGISTSSLMNRTMDTLCFLQESALGRFGRFTLFSPRVSYSKHLPCSFCFVLCFGFGVFVALLCFCFLFCKCFGIPNSPRSLDLDDRQGLIASSAMQQKKSLPQVPQGPHQQRHQFQTRIWTRNWSHSCTSNLTPSPQRPGSHLWNFARA